MRRTTQKVERTRLTAAIMRTPSARLPHERAFVVAESRSVGAALGRAGDPPSRPYHSIVRSGACSAASRVASIAKTWSRPVISNRLWPDRRPTRSRPSLAPAGARFGQVGDEPLVAGLDQTNEALLELGSRVEVSVSHDLDDPRLAIDFTIAQLEIHPAPFAFV
jgi:hypothetical protein